MRSLIIISFMVGQLLQSQTNNAHVVYFETGQYNVPDIETNRLVLFIQSLKNIQIERISIYGFTDDRGSDNYNLTLSQNRANAIKKIFSKINFRFLTDANIYQSDRLFCSPTIRSRNTRYRQGYI